MVIGCIYLATNTVNGKAYVGKTAHSLGKRKGQHRRDAWRTTSVFHKAIVKYGFEAFEWCELYLSDDEDALFRAEIAIIEATKAAGVVLYNMSTGGEGPSGYERPAEHRKALSDSRTGMKFSAEHCANIGKSKMGCKMPAWTPERRAKMELFFAQKRKRTPEQRAKLSASAKAILTPERRAVLKANGAKGLAARWGRNP